MAASAQDIEEFLAGPLVTWLATCVRKPETLQIYETFFDGAPISEVLLQIDPEPSHPVPSPGNLQGLNITSARIKIFYCIIRNIKNVFEEELGQVVVCLPDCVTLGRAPASEAALEQMKLLLLLLLGCAVQGPTKEHFITKIKELPLDAQHDIVDCIKQVTDDQSIVLTQDWSEQSPQKLYTHLRALTGERDKLLQQWMTDLSQEQAMLLLSMSNNNNGNGGDNLSLLGGSGHLNQQGGVGGGVGGQHSLLQDQGGVESNHLAVELADWKARLRKQRQELEEKTELLVECREELEHANALVAKLKAENVDLLMEARRAKAYRDEVDAMRERAERADRLELECQRYRERLADAEFYKVRVDELREDNRVLLETREMLEAQLARARQRADRALELEAELMGSKQSFNEILVERDAAREKIQELLEENLQLQQVTKSALAETSACCLNSTSSADDFDRDDPNNSGDNSLSEQLTNNAQARALRLELENKKLLSTIELLKEKSLHENANKLLELEKEKKKLMLKCEQLQESCDRVQVQNNELEGLFKNALQENRKLQDSVDTVKVISDRQAQDLQNEKIKVQEMEKTIESLTKEKQRIQTLCDSIKKRADDAEKSLNQISDQLQSVQLEAEKSKEMEKLGSELRDKVAALEKENSNTQKEVVKLKELLEIKDVALDTEVDKSKKQEKEIQRLLKDNENAISQLEKLQEFEHKVQELMSQASVHAETIQTLQKDLISQKITNEKFKSNVEKLGLNLDIMDNDINIIVEKLLSNPDVAKSIQVFVEKERISSESSQEEKSAKEVSEKIPEKEIVLCCQKCDNKSEEDLEKITMEMQSLQSLNEQLQSENAKMQVDISTLKSQINSLQTQQTALQLANSQLVAEKEELSKQQDIQNSQHDTLLLDQVKMQEIHEKLNAEYEQLKKEEDTLKKLNRDLRSEIRSLKETNSNQIEKVSNLEAEKECFKNDAKNLGILRTEHSKLKDDFRNLFTASERLKVEYRAVQEELKTLRTESRTLRLGHTEMQGELNSRSDLLAGLQMDNAKLQQKCDMLFEMNHSLDSDRRALMDHVSQLLSQYHSLLTHSLEDKQHYHVEEKLYADKVNNLCRQKEKLEEKIMEHYRKLDNASAKKKGFGATLVRRVRKAGSDIINKVPSRNRRSWHEDTTSTRLAQSQLTLLGGTTLTGAVTGISNNSGESANNDSDNSLDETFSNRSEQTSSFKRATSTPGGGGGGSLHGQRPRDEVALMRRSHRDTASHRNSIASIGGSRGNNNDPSYSTSREPERNTTTTTSALSLGSVGSRRTVYLSEDEPPTVASSIANATAPASGRGTPPCSSSPQIAPSVVITSTPQNNNNNNNNNSNSNNSSSSTMATAQPPLLVYNRISTIIGGADTASQRSSFVGGRGRASSPQLSSQLPQQQQQQSGIRVGENSAGGGVAVANSNDDNNRRKQQQQQQGQSENSKETAVWYEYGCV